MSIYVHTNILMYIYVYMLIYKEYVYIYIYTLLFLNMFGTSYRYGINPEKPISLSRSVVTAQNGAFVVETAGLYCSISSFTSEVEEKCPSGSPAMKLTANIRKTDIHNTHISRYIYIHIHVYNCIYIHYIHIREYVT